MYYRFYTQQGQFVTRILTNSATIYKINSKEIPFKEIKGDSQIDTENNVVNFITMFEENDRELITEEKFNKIIDDLFLNKFT